MASGFIFFFLLIVALCSCTLTATATLTGTPCDTCYRHSKAAFFGSTAALSGGACGYRGDALRYYGGHLAAAAPSIYKDGVYCGACYEVRCMNRDLCSKRGTQVVVTDLHKPKDNSNTTDLVLSTSAFKAMANPGKDKNLINLGLVDIEYKRIPCGYKNRNLSLRVENHSNAANNYLAITVLFQGGQTEIGAIEIAKETNPSNWVSMTRNYGAVWDTKRVPDGGPLMMRFRVTYGFDGKTVWAKKALPAKWKVGAVYSTDVQIDDVDIGGCYPCEKSRLD